MSTACYNAVKQAYCQKAAGKGPGGFSGIRVSDMPEKDGVGHHYTPKHTSLSTYNEFGIPPYGNDGSVHCPKKFLHDYLDMPLSWTLKEDTPVKTNT